MDHFKINDIKEKIKDIEIKCSIKLSKQK